MATQADAFLIRPATNADVPRVKEIVFSVLEQYGLRPDPAATDADLDNLDATYFLRGGAFEVVVSPEGEVVGTVGLLPLSAWQAELRKMYLVPSVRGLGLGKRLLERMLQFARQRGFQEIVLETNSVLKEAIGLYRRYGFVPTAAGHLSSRCDQAYLLRLWPAWPAGGAMPTLAPPPSPFPPPGAYAPLVRPMMPPPLPSPEVGVPRRFGMGILLVIATLYGLLFGVLRALDAHPIVFLSIALFFTAVGVGQAVLFKGNKPRLASILVGVALGGVAVLVPTVWFGWRDPRFIVMTLAVIVSYLPYALALGGLCGYLAGVLIAGVFCLMDEWQKRRARREGPIITAEVADDPLGGSAQAGTAQGE